MVTAADCLDALPEFLLALLLHDESVRAYLVGGFVRDLLLDRPNHDVDLAVDGDPLRLARAIAAHSGGAVVPLDPERGTWRVMLRRPEGPIRMVDLTRLRAPDLAGDLCARDFTINAIAVDLGGPGETGPRFVDPTGGLEDLRRRRIRVAGSEAFVDDPVRLLRAVRFSVQLGFEIDEASERLARSAAPLLCRTAPERQRDEFTQVLACDDAAIGVRMLDGLGLLTVLLPDLELCRGVRQPKEHYYDVLEHSLHTLGMLDLVLRRAAPSDGEEATLWHAVWDSLSWVPHLREWLDEELGEGRSRRTALKLAGLLHDVSKPETKTVDPQTGKTHFYGHAEHGAARAEVLARALRFSGREIRYISLLIEEHLRPGMLAAPGEVPTRRALFRLFRDLGGASGDLLLLNLADHAAARGPRLTREEWSSHIDYVAWVLRMLYEDDRVARPPKLIAGDDLIREFGLRPGPIIGRLLEAIREAQAEGDVTDSAGALALARQALAGAGAAAEDRGG